MKVILQEDVPHLGQTGEIVKVKDGYARNYLVPRGMAVVADERNMKQLEHNRRIAQARAAKVVAAAKELGADSLTYLPVEAIDKVFKSSRCAACFDGCYPQPLSQTDKEGIVGDRLSVQKP